MVDNNFNFRVGQRIRNRRNEINMTMKELGEKVNLSEATIQRYESGKIKGVDVNLLNAIAEALYIEPAYIMGWEASEDDLLQKKKGVKIPVLGKIVAGIPIEAITDILDYEEIDESIAKRGSFFALKVTGQSMEPTIKENDIVIVRQQPDVENGEIAVVMVNSNEATLKRIRIQADGIWLMPDNPAACAAKFYTGEEIATLPVAIIGKVIELRRNF